MAIPRNVQKGRTQCAVTAATCRDPQESEPQEQYGDVDLRFQRRLVRDLRGERREVETYASLDFALNERFARRLGECNFSGRIVIAGMRGSLMRGRAN